MKNKGKHVAGASENTLVVDLSLPPLLSVSQPPNASATLGSELEQSLSRKELMQGWSLTQLIDAFILLEDELRQSIRQNQETKSSHVDILNNHASLINAHAGYINNHAGFINKHTTDIKQMQLGNDSQAAIIAEQQARIHELEGKVKELEGRVEADQTPKNVMQQDIDDKIKAIEESVKVSRTWAEVVRDPSRVISQAMVEHEKRATKALNIRVRGVQFENKQGDLLEAAQTYIGSTFDIPGTSVVAAWKGKFQPSLTFMRFQGEISRLQVLRKRSCLKGTNQFIDEDLTPIQWNERKKWFAEAKSKNQRVIFRDRRPIFIPNSNAGSS